MTLSIMSMHLSAAAEDRGVIHPTKPVNLNPSQVAELHRRDAAFLIAPIKSESDLKEYVALMELGHSPLKAMPYGARQRFLQSLTFNETGLTGFNYADLQKELTAAQTYQVLALFGKQHTSKLIKNDKPDPATDSILLGLMGDGGGEYPTDYSDRKCSSRATCSVSPQDICMGSC